METHFQIPLPPEVFNWKKTKPVSYKTAQSKSVKDPVGTLYWQIPDNKKSYMYLKLAPDLWLCLGDKKFEKMIAEWVQFSKKPPKESAYARDFSLAQVISDNPKFPDLMLNKSTELILVEKAEKAKLKKQKRPW